MDDDHCASCGATDSPIMWESESVGRVLVATGESGWRMFVKGDLLFIVCADCQETNGWTADKWVTWFAIEQREASSQGRSTSV
jgi:hypothetical protein